jgi:hypothetical protein
VGRGVHSAGAGTGVMQCRAHRDGFLVDVCAHLDQLGDDGGGALPRGRVERGPPVLRNFCGQKYLSTSWARSGRWVRGRTFDDASLTPPFPRPILAKYSSHLFLLASFSGLSAVAEELAPMGSACGQGAKVGYQSLAWQGRAGARPEAVPHRCTAAAHRATGAPGAVPVAVCRCPCRQTSPPGPSRAVRD